MKVSSIGTSKGNSNFINTMNLSNEFVGRKSNC